MQSRYDQDGTAHGNDSCRTRRGRPVGDRDKKRSDILNVAISILAREGAPGLSMRKVASHVGASTGTLTYYFANKDELMRAVTDELFNQFESLLAQSDESFNIEKIVDDWVVWTTGDNISIWQAFFQLQSYAAQEPSFVSFVQRKSEQLIALLTQVILRGQMESMIRKDIPADILAEQVSAMGDGLMMTLSIYPDRLTTAKVEAIQRGLITLISPK